MKFHQIFSASLYEPKKLAAFRLLSVGKVFAYVFLFVTLFTLISFSRYIFGDATLFAETPELMEQGEKIGALIYPMAFLLQLVISTFYIFIRISIFAYIGMLLLKALKKRGDYLQIWRTSAIAMTVPFLITVVFDFFPMFNTSSLVISSVIHLIYILAAIKYYPKQPKLNV